MLARLDSRELSEWQAYEVAFGPIGERYSGEVLAGIHEQIQQINYLLGAAHFTEKNGENPVPEVRRFPRPHELHKEFETDGE